MSLKRDRSSNYSKEDSRNLVDIIKKHADILENKKTDAVTVRDKQLAWETVALEFNAVSLIHRTHSQLRGKYDKLKKLTRAKGAAEKQALYGTGGGAYVCPKFEDSDLLEDIRGMIPLSTEGLPSRNDSDYINITEEPHVSTQRDTLSPSASNDGYIGHSFPLYSEEFDMDEVIEEHTVPVVIVTSSEAFPVASTSATENDSRDTRKSSQIADWTKYSPASMKRPKHPALTASKKKSLATSSQDWASRRRPSLLQEPEPAMSNNSTRFSHWADGKKELANTQRELIIKEFNLKSKHLAEIHELELKIKNKQFDILIQEEEKNKKLIENLEVDTKVKNLTLEFLKLDLKTKSA